MHGTLTPTTAVSDIKTAQNIAQEAIKKWMDEAQLAKDALPLMQQIGKRFDEECANERKQAFEAARTAGFDIDKFIADYEKDDVKGLPGGRVFKNDVEASKALDMRFRGFVNNPPEKERA